MNSRQRNNPELFGRMSSDFGFIPISKTFPVPKEVMSLVFTEEGIKRIEGIALEFTVISESNNHQNSLNYQFYLSMKTMSRDKRIAKLTSEESFYIDDQKKVRFTNYSVTSVERLPGVQSEKATHLLASCVGAFFSKQIVNQSRTLIPGYTLDVTLMYEMSKDVDTLEAYWKLEAAVEKYVSPYSNRSSSEHIKITSTI